MAKVKWKTTMVAFFITNILGGYALNKMLLLLAQGSAPKSRITNAEATVVQKLNQGTIPQSGCNRLGVPFFGYFFGQAKK